MDNYKKTGEKDNSLLKERTCEALFLQFKEPIVYDLYIPNCHEIYSLIVIAGKILNGQKIIPSKVNCISTRQDVFENILKKEYFSGLSKKVFFGIHNSIDESKQKHSELFNYMMYREDILGSERHITKGTWFRFREGKRKEIEDIVNNYFKTFELEDFDKIGKIIKPYIGLTNSPGKL